MNTTKEVIAKPLGAQASSPACSEKTGEKPAYPAKPEGFAIATKEVLSVMLALVLAFAPTTTFAAAATETITGDFPQIQRNATEIRSTGITFTRPNEDRDITINATNATVSGTLTVMNDRTPIVVYTIKAGTTQTFNINTRVERPTYMFTY